MDFYDFRYVLSFVLIVILPVVTAFWLVIHGGIAYWRHRPPWQAYSVALIAIVGTLAVTVAYAQQLIGPDLGHNPVLIVFGALIYLSSWALSRSIRKYLDFRTFAGVPEVKNEAGALITDGPFSAVRHPRYFMILIGTLGWAMLANHLGGYVMAGAFAAILVVIVQLEERELITRYGHAYEAYKARVPQLFPAPSRLSQLFV
ncbi:MAG: isoprenylcysteine carboxylmethyltransferase family protein [Pseudomonadota bacterium]